MEVRVGMCGGLSDSGLMAGCAWQGVLCTLYVS